MFTANRGSYRSSASYRSYRSNLESMTSFVKKKNLTVTFRKSPKPYMCCKWFNKSFQFTCPALFFSFFAQQFVVNNPVKHSESLFRRDCLLPPSNCPLLISPMASACVKSGLDCQMFCSRKLQKSPDADPQVPTSLCVGRVQMLFYIQQAFLLRSDSFNLVLLDKDPRVDF